MHVHCSGKGSPTVVIENGFDEFSTDWVLVQEKIAKFTRVCTYDRPGYAWSAPGPKPRTYDQINLDLHEALKAAGERGPLVLAGHSFGGPVIWNYTKRYPNEVSGLVFAEAVGESHRILMGPKTALIADFAEHKAIPEPHLKITETDRPAKRTEGPDPDAAKITPPYDRLPRELQNAHSWAMMQLALSDAEDSERAWSPEYLALWRARSQKGSLGDVPVIVLARRNGGFGEGHGIPAAQLETERKLEQANLAALSRRGELRFVEGGHEIQLEAPDEVARAVSDLVHAARSRK